MPPDAPLLHPGPMNAGVEIAASVAHGPPSLIARQVTNGVAVRMALLYLLAAGPDQLQVAVTKQQVQDAPNIEQHGEGLSPEDESALYHHYELNYTPPNLESGRRLARAFCGDTGRSSGRWGTRVGRQASLPHLGEGRPGGAVARLVGYRTTSAYVAAFRAHTGVTPGRYFQRSVARRVLR